MEGMSRRKCGAGWGEQRKVCQGMREGAEEKYAKEEEGKRASMPRRKGKQV